MADQFQIPQRNPPSPQFQPPTDLVNAYLNRQTPAEYATQGLANVGNQYALYKQYQLQKNLELLKAKASVFGEGGPVLMGQLFGTGQPSASPTAQSQSAGQIQAQPPVSPQSGSIPDQSQPTQQPMAPITASTTPAGAVAGQTYHPNDPYGTIQASVNMGHADHLGLYPSAQGDQSTPAGNPQLGQHQQKIQQIQAQMAQNSQMGAYGQKLNQGLNDQLLAEKALMEGEQFNVGQQRQQSQFEQSQNAEENRFQRTQKTKQAETITGATEKQNEPIANLKMIDDAYGQLKTALGQNKPSPSANVRGRIAESMGTPTPFGIPIGSKSAQDVNEAAAGMRAALASEITRSGRYTPFVDQILNALVPTAKDQNWQDKLQRIQSFRQAVASGVNQNIDNAVSSVLGGKVNVGGLPAQGTQTAQASNIHSQAMQWAQDHPNDPRAKAIIQKARASLGAQ